MQITLNELIGFEGRTVAVDRGVEAVARRRSADAEVRFTTVAGAEAVVLVLGAGKLHDRSGYEGQLPVMALCPLDIDETEGLHHEVRTLDGVLVQRMALTVDAGAAV